MPSRTDACRQGYDAESRLTGHVPRAWKEPRLMARLVKATKTKKPATPTRKPGRPAAATAKPSAKVTRTTAAPEHAGAAAPAAPKLSKDELRARVEQLEHANATLRTKS